jgi:hypothetical protein
MLRGEAGFIIAGYEQNLYGKAKKIRRPRIFCKAGEVLQNLEAANCVASIKAE